MLRVENNVNGYVSYIDCYDTRDISNMYLVTYEMLGWNVHLEPIKRD